MDLFYYVKLIQEGFTLTVPDALGEQRTEARGQTSHRRDHHPEADPPRCPEQGLRARARALVGSGLRACLPTGQRRNNHHGQASARRHGTRQPALG